MRPIDVTPENSQEIWERIYKKFLRTGVAKSNLRVGDFVRMSKDKRVFDKEFLPNFSDEIVSIDKIRKGDPNVYFVKDDAGEPFLTRFYKEELSKIRKDKEMTYRIEKIIKERTRNGKKEYLVKFIDYPNPEWIKESDIEK